jgi:hypothetical protein
MYVKTPSHQSLSRQPLEGALGFFVCFHFKILRPLPQGADPSHGKRVP